MEQAAVAEQMSFTSRCKPITAAIQDWKSTGPFDLLGKLTSINKFLRYFITTLRTCDFAN
jgi:hypothetical protein